MITSHSTTTRYDGNPNNNNGGLRRCPFTCRAWSGTVVDIDEDIAMLFGNDDFEDDASKGFDEEEPSSIYEVGGPSTTAAEGPSFPLQAPGLPIPPSVIEDLSTRLGSWGGWRGVVKKSDPVSDAEVRQLCYYWGDFGPKGFLLLMDIAGDGVPMGSYKEQHNSAAADNGPQDKQSNGAHDGSPLTAIGQCIERMKKERFDEDDIIVRMEERKDWRFQSNGDIRSHPGEPIKVANALSRMLDYGWPESNRDLVKIISKELGHLASQVMNVIVIFRGLNRLFDLQLQSRLVAVDGSDGTEHGYQGRIMGEPLSPDRVFDFPADESEPHPACDFFALGPLPGYAGNPNNNNGWIEVDVPLLGELGVVTDEPMVGPMVDEIIEPIVEAKDQMIALVVDMDEEIAMLFSNDDFEDDAS
ncbi:hypothetical protein Tco_0525078 [Tanacetum coccineum]